MTKELQTLTVADLMTHTVLTARESDTIRDAHSVMRLARIRHLPVINQRGDLIGVVSDRDLHRAWSRGWEARVAEVMNRHTRWVHPQTPARDAAAYLLRDKIGSLMVVDDDQNILGIITETDFLEVAHRALTIQQLVALSA